MIDFVFDGGGATTTGTTSGTYTSAVTIPAPRADHKIKELEAKAESYRKEIIALRKALDEANKETTDTNFSKDELTFILSKVHPDKNPNSEVALELTKKLISRRK